MPSPIHASCVAVEGRAVLLRGPSGSGKSDLALRLIDSGAILVADDQVVLEAIDGVLFASPPAPLAGKIEVRGIGIVEDQPWRRAPVALVVDLVPPDRVERLPEPQTCLLDGGELPCFPLAAFEASAPAKIRLALASLEAADAKRNIVRQR
tara:strand:+ start:709 stop:1161 length:453 start_codon:yes stop_codon:yes gene_type:complete